MNIPQGLFKFYGPRIYRDTDDKGGGGNSDQTDWKAKYETLQGQIASGQYVNQESYITLQRNLQKAVDEKKAAESNLGIAQGKIALLTDGETTLKTQMQQLQESNTKLQGDLTAAGAKLERHNVIFKDFPHLAPFEADGLIPDPKEGQKLEDVLNAFSTKVQTLTGKAVEQFKQGSTDIVPPKKTEEGEKSAQTLFNEAKALMSANDLKGYEQKMNAYHLQKAKEQSGVTA